MTMLDKLLKLGTNTKVSVPIVLLLGLVWLGFQADDLSVSYLDRFFVTDVQAQELGERVAQLEGAVNGLGEKIDGNRVAAIEREIFNVRIAQCMSEGPLRTLYADQIAKLVSEWRSLTGQPQANPPTLVDCSELG